MKKYILFDNDGVLVETEYWYYRANKRALAFLGLDLPRDAYLALMAAGVSPWERARSRGIAECEIERGRALRNLYYREYLMTEDIGMDEVLPTLAELAHRYRMGIVTTSRRADFDLIHEKRGILDYMEFCLTLEDYKRAKPRPDPYLAALARFGAAAAEAMVVEDSERGLRSSTAAGIDCIIVANGFTAAHDFSAATARIEKFSGLPAAIESLAKRNSRSP